MGPEADALVARPHSLSPIDDEEVERLLRTVALRVVRLLRKRGKLDNVSCDGVLDALRAQATQRRLPRTRRSPNPQAPLRLLGRPLAACQHSGTRE